MPLIDPVTMSQSASTKTGPRLTAGKPETIPTATQPIHTASSPTAQAIRHAQPALLSALFLVRFDALVADPVSAMLTTLPVVTAIQGAYAVACLPPAGSQGVRKPRPGEKKKTENEPNAIVVSLLPPPPLFPDRL